MPRHTGFEISYPTQRTHIAFHHGKSLISRSFKIDLGCVISLLSTKLHNHVFYNLRVRVSRYSTYDTDAAQICMDPLTRVAAAKNMF